MTSKESLDTVTLPTFPDSTAVFITFVKVLSMLVLFATATSTIVTIFVASFL